MKKWSRFFLTVVLCLVIIIYEPLAVLASCEITEGSDENQFITEFTDGNSDAVGETVPDQNDDADVKSEDCDINQDEFTDGEDSEITEEFQDEESIQEEELAATFTDDVAVFSDAEESLRDTVIVLDCSGSMGGTPLAVMKQTAVKFCEQLISAKGRTAIVYFSGNASVLVDFTRDGQLLEEKIDSLYAEGGTNTTAAMEKAYELLEGSLAITKNIVLMTDGQAESGRTSADGPYNSGENYMYANALYKSVINMHQSCNVYTMGFFHSISGNKRSFLEGVLKDIQNAGYYEVKSAEDITFAFGDVADDINDVNQDEEEAFIQKHKIFLEQLDYIKFIREQNAASQVIRCYGSSYEGFAKWKIVTGGVSDNPYDIVLADLLLSEESSQAQLEAIEAGFWQEIPSIANSVITLIDGEVPLEPDTKNAIQKLFCLDDKTDSKTYKLLQDLFKNKISSQTLNRTLNMIADAETVNTFLGRGNDIVNSVIDIINYAAVVRAYAKASKEFKQVLILADYYTNNALMESAILEYCSIDSEEEVKKRIRDKILQEGSHQVVGICSDIFGDALVGTVQKYLYSAMGLSTAGVAAAAEVSAFIAGCKIGYDAGRLFCSKFLNLDEASEAYFLAYASARLTEALQDVLESDINNFKDRQDIQGAKWFCQAFGMYKHAQMACVDRTIEYVSAIATAKVSHYNDYVADMYNWLVYKAYWSGLVCHDPDSINIYYTAYKKTFIKIACPTDIRIVSDNGMIVADIKNNEVVSVGNNVQAVVVNQKKFIFVPSDQNYQLQITASGNGTMEYAVSKLTENGKVISGVYTSDIKLNAGKTYSGNLQTDNSSVKDGILTVDGEKVNADTQIIEGDVLNSIALSKEKLVLTRGKQSQLKVTFNPVSCAESLTWKSDNPKIVSVDKNGKVKGNAAGRTTVRAYSESGLSASCQVTVKTVHTKDIHLNVKNKTLYKNKKYKLKVTLQPSSSTDKVVWKSSDKKVAVVSSDGTVTAKSKGKATITVSSGKKKTTCRITVKEIPVKKIKLNKSKLTLYKGKTRRLTAQISPEKSTDKVIWKSSNKKIAIVDSRGNVLGIRKGKAFITVESGKIKTKCSVTVKEVPSVNVAFEQSFFAMEKGQKMQITAVMSPLNSTDNCEWSSSAPEIVSVNDSGMLTALKSGQAQITVITETKKTATCQITVKDLSITQIELSNKTLYMNQGESKQLKASVTPYDTNQIITWQSSDEEIVSVDQTGLIQAKKMGSATIIASAPSGIEATCRVSVRTPVKNLSLDKTTVTIIQGVKYRLGVTVTPFMLILQNFAGKVQIRI